jgi:hypothetical protein
MVKNCVGEVVTAGLLVAEFDCWNVLFNVGN